MKGVKILLFVNFDRCNARTCWVGNVPCDYNSCMPFILHTSIGPRAASFIALLAFPLLAAAAACQPAPGLVSTATLSQPPAARTLRPTTVPENTYLLFKDNPNTFIYFDSCFDLDRGVGTRGLDPECDFIIRPMEDEGAGEIMLEPFEPARFTFGREFHTRPSPEECSQAASLSSGARAVDPQAGNYICFLTNSNHIGYLYFLQSASNGVSFEWHTYETLAQLQATATPTPLPVYASGLGTTLVVGDCISLDSGETGPAFAPLCDLSLQIDENGSIQLAALEPARLSVQLLDASPDRVTCAATLVPTEEEEPAAAVLHPERYLCYRSQEGRTGWLYLVAIEEDILKFNWLTLDPPEGEKSVSSTPEVASAEQIYASENDRFIYFRSCFDLDDGIEFSGDHPACDFSLFRGPGSSNSIIEFAPAALSRFAFGDVFYQEPAAWECRRALTFSSAILTANPYGIDATHICYQTDEGRYGVFQFEALGQDGITIDWQTYDPPSSLPPADPQSTPPPSPENWPPGKPVWEDQFEDAENWTLYQDQDFGFGVEDGRLQMAAYTPEGQDGWVTAWPRLADFYLEGVFSTGSMCSGLDRYGLWFRASGSQKDSSGYLFGVSCSGHYMLRFYDGFTYDDLIPWTANGLIQPGPGQSHRLGVLAEGDRLAIYLNGVELDSIQDSAHQGANFGVFSGAAATADLRISVERIAFWDLP